MAVFTVVVILFLFAATYLRAGDHILRSAIHIEHLDRGQTDALRIRLPH